MADGGREGTVFKIGQGKGGGAGRKKTPVFFLFQYVKRDSRRS